MITDTTANDSAPLAVLIASFSMHQSFYPLRSIEHDGVTLRRDILDEMRGR